MASENAGKHYTLDRLEDGIYAAIAKGGGAAIGNAGLIDLGESALVVDTFVTPSAAEDLRADAERLTGRPPRWVVNTHYHNDHIWGNQVFLPEADLIGTVHTRALIQTAGKEEYDDYRAIADDRLKTFLTQQSSAATDLERETAGLMAGYFRGLVHDFPRLRVTLPNVTFEERMTLHGSRRRAELIAFSGAHTGSDTLVHLPDDGIVLMSDLLFIGFHPYMADGDPDRLLVVLRSILDDSGGMQSASRFVPGHGPVGTRADVEQMIVYVQECQRIARELAAAGKASPEEVASTPIPEPFTNWTLPRFFYANLGFLLKKYSSNGREPAKAEPRFASNSFRP